MNDVRQTLDSICDLEITIAESEMTACESLISMCDKMEMIQENYSGDIDGLDNFKIFQEGEKMDALKEDYKKQTQGKSTLNKIIFAIPRMIMSLFRLITGQLKKIDSNTSARIDKQLQTDEAYSSAVGTFIQGIKHPQTKGGTVARNVVAILLAGATAAGAVFGGKKLFDHIKKETNNFQGKSFDEKMENLLKIGKGDSEKVKQLKTSYKSFWEKLKGMYKKDSKSKEDYLKLLNFIDKSASNSLREVLNGADKKDINKCEKLKKDVVTLCIDSTTDTIFGKLHPDEFLNDKTVRDTICKILQLKDKTDENIKNTLKEEGIVADEELVKAIQDDINKIQDQITATIEKNADTIGLKPDVILNNIIETNVDGLISKGKKLLVSKLRTCFDINEITKKIETAGAALVAGVTDTGDKANGIWRQQFSDKDKPVDFNGIFEFTDSERNRKLVSVKDKKKLDDLKNSFQKTLPLIFMPKKPSDAIELTKLASGTKIFDFNKGITSSTTDLDHEVEKFVNEIIKYIDACNKIMGAIVEYILCVYDVAEKMYYVTTDGKMYVKTEKGKKKFDKHQEKLDKKDKEEAEKQKQKKESNHGEDTNDNAS